MKNKIILFLFLFLFLFLILTGGNAECSPEMDYLLKFSNPAYKEITDLFQLTTHKSTNNPKYILKEYKKLSDKVNHLKELKQGVIDNFSNSYIGRGMLAKSVYYVDYMKFLVGSYNSGKDSYLFIKNNEGLIKSKKTLPDLIEFAVNLGEKKLSNLSRQIKKSTQQKLQEEKNREIRLIQSEKDIKELESLIHNSTVLSQKNDIKEQQIKAKKAQKSISNSQKPFNKSFSEASQSPKIACAFLRDFGLYTGSWKNLYDNKFSCNSPYKNIGTGFPLPNSLAYYVDGKINLATQAKLVLNVNNKSQSQSAHSILLSASEALSMKIMGMSLPKTIRNSISKGNSFKMKNGQVTIEVKRDNWSTGKGYEIHVVFK